MTYPNFIFSSRTPLYLNHEHILEYHRTHARSYHLRLYIHFNHSVLSTEWQTSESHISQNAKTECRESANSKLKRATGKVLSWGCWNVTFVLRNNDDAVIRGCGGAKSEFFHHLAVASGSHHIPSLYVGEVKTSGLRMPNRGKLLTLFGIEINVIWEK